MSNNNKKIDILKINKIFEELKKENKINLFPYFKKNAFEYILEKHQKHASDKWNFLNNNRNNDFSLFVISELLTIFLKNEDEAIIKNKLIDFYYNRKRRYYSFVYTKKQRALFFEDKKSTIKSVEDKDGHFKTYKKVTSIDFLDRTFRSSEGDKVTKLDFVGNDCYLEQRDDKIDALEEKRQQALNKIENDYKNKKLSKSTFYYQKNKILKLNFKKSI